MGVAEVLDAAEARGFTHNFAWEGGDSGGGRAGGQLRCSEHGECVAEHDARIVDSIPVDMGTDPGDDATVYLIEGRNGLKGYLILADPFHADPDKAAFIDRLLGKH